jgi:DNA-binding LacI/PurR family transcriptional regulator
MTDSSPQYIQIADHLRDQIQSGQILVGQKIPNEMEIASQYGVSRGTVRQALDLLVKEGLLERFPGKGTFVIEQTEEDCAKRIGVIVPFLRDDLSARFLRGMESILREHQYSLIYSSSEGDVNLECEQVRRLLQDQVCGLIVMPVSASNEAMLLCQVLPPGMHIVLLDRELPGYQASIVSADNRGGAKQAVNHLLELGHRRIACISHKGKVSSVNERVRGYEETMRAAGLMPLAAIPLEWHGPSDEGLPTPFTPEELKPLISLLESPQSPTAMFCVNDFTTFGVMQCLLDRGIKIPEDISLVGFDDIPLASFMPVPLTTVAQPKQEIGRRAVQVLLKMIEEDRIIPERIRLPTSLVIRSSTGAV